MDKCNEKSWFFLFMFLSIVQFSCPVSTDCHFIFHSSLISQQNPFLMENINYWQYVQMFFSNYYVFSEI